MPLDAPVNFFTPNRPVWNMDNAVWGRNRYIISKSNPVNKAIC